MNIYEKIWKSMNIYENLWKKYAKNMNILKNLEKLWKVDLRKQNFKANSGRGTRQIENKNQKKIKNL